MNRPRFRLPLAAAGAAAIAAAIALPASPAAAAPPVSQGGSCNGPTCGFYLYQHMTITGDNQEPHSSGPPVTVNPPPCWYQPDVPNSDPVAFVSWAIGQDPDSFVNKDGRTGKASLGDGEPHLVTEELQHAHAHVDTQKNKLVFDGGSDAGGWYDLNGYAQYGPAAANCMNVPLDVFYVFAGNGTPPPPPQPVPGIDIAHWLANNMTVPKPQMTISPQTKGYVNLATYVWAKWAASRMTGTMNKYQIRGTLGNESVTVTAVPSQFIINFTGQGKQYTSCSVTPDTNGYAGSHSPLGHPPNNPPGTPPDCGILYSAPVKASDISVKVVWQRSWTGVNVPDGPGGALPPGEQTSDVKTLPVAEIQSINSSG